MTEFLSPLLAQASGAGSALNFLLLPLLLGGLFFVLIRPQRKRQKELQQLREQIGVGDEVMTSSGIYGFITGEEDDLYWLEIDQDVQIRISKAAIHSRVPDPADSTNESTANSSADTKAAGSNKSSQSKNASNSANGASNKGASTKGASAKGASKASNKQTKNAKNAKTGVADETDSDSLSESASIDVEADS